MLRKRIVIHAGSHKTGSSAIQRYLFERQHEIEGLAYLCRAERPNSSLWMLQAFKQDVAELPAFRHRQLTAEEVEVKRQRARAQLTKLASAVTAPLTILSAESIGTFNSEELQSLRDVLAPHFDDISLHQYFRPLKARMESAFQEKLKHTAASLMQTYRLAYCRTIELQDAVFGAEQVISYKYDEALFPQGDVVLDFLAQLGVTAPQAQAARPVNVSLSLHAIQLLYVYRRYYTTPCAQDKAVVRRLKALPGPPLRFHSELYRQLVVIRPGEVERFEQRAGFSVEQDVTADDELGIRDPQDLLTIPAASRAWLQQQVGGAPVAATDYRAIADAVAALAGMEGQA